MGRFLGANYNPADDSSERYHGQDLANVILDIAARPDGTLGCPCGCNDVPAGPQSIFRMGHDAKLRGKLIRAHLMGAQIVEIRDGVPAPPKAPMDIARQHGWESVLTDADARREATNRSLATRALRSKRLIKVGRWEYTGQVIAIRRSTQGAMLWDVQYVDKLGITHKLTIPADSAPEVKETA